ncbi:MAG: hypothetical protein JSR91_27160 [Proteobacteria bacterium]|nr:hypothetical protein [Pseudomonadota bacterium]
MRVVAILVLACLSVGACTVRSTTVREPAPGVAPATTTSTTTTSIGLTE